MDWSNLSEVNAITPDWVAENVDHVWAKAEGKHPMWSPPSNQHREPWAWSADAGLWRADNMGEYSVLCWIPVDGMVAGEGDWENALRYESTRQYIAWMKAGIMPPPPAVVQHMKGHLNCLNRRRWLAAREAGVERLLCWYSPTNPERPARSAWWLPEESSHYWETWRNAGDRGYGLRGYLGEYAYERMLRKAKGHR